MLGSMRAVRITRDGGPEVLEWLEAPDPVCGPDDVLVRVRSSALNRADLLQRRGLYPAPPDAPADIPGLEFAGVVKECGARARGFRPGDRVMGILGGGGHAEMVALHHRLCLRIPPTLDWKEAAAIPEVFLTAFDALYTQGGLTTGEVVLVQAAASGVGTAAMQLARAGGGRPIGLARTAAKRERLREAGLRPVFDPAAEDLPERIRIAGGGAGVDLILDVVGAAAWPLHRRVLRERGRVVVIGLLGGSRLELDLALLLRKRWTLRGSVLRSRPLEEKIRLVQEFSGRMLTLFASGDLRPWVDRSFPIRDVAQAHEFMERNANVGKIVLTLADEE